MKMVFPENTQWLACFRVLPLAFFFDAATNHPKSLSASENRTVRFTVTILLITGSYGVSRQTWASHKDDDNALSSKGHRCSQISLPDSCPRHPVRRWRKIKPRPTI